MKRFRGGLAFKAHRLVYRSTLGWRVMKKKKRRSPNSKATDLEFHAQLGDGALEGLRILVYLVIYDSG